MLAVEDVPSLKVAELKDELKNIGLPVSGLKAALAARLTEYLEDQVTAQGDAEDAEAPVAADAPGAAEQAEAVPAADEAAGAERDLSAKVPASPSAANPQLQSDAPLAPAAAEAAVAAVTPAAKPAASDDATPAALPAPATETSARAAAPVSLPDGAGAPDDGPAAPADASPAGAAVPNKPADAAPLSGAPATSPVVAASDVDAASSPPRSSPVSTAAVPAAEVTMTAAAHADEAPAMQKESEPSPKPAAQQQAALATPALLVEPTQTQAEAAPTAMAAAEEGPEAMDNDEAPEVDFDADPEEEAAEEMKTAKATQADGKRKAAAGVLRPGAKAARITANGAVTGATAGKHGGVPVPPPDREPTRSLRIDGLMRPFSKPQLEQLLSQDQCVLESVWMPSLKTHCYAIFATAEYAEAIRQATFNLQWPKGSQKRLAPRFVTEDEAKTAAAGSLVGGGSAPSPAAQPATTTGAGTGQVDARRDILERRQQREAEAAAKVPAPAAAEEPRELELEDLFRKTETLPSLYWLPVADKSKVVTVPAA